MILLPQATPLLLVSYPRLPFKLPPRREWLGICADTAQLCGLAPCRRLYNADWQNAMGDNANAEYLYTELADREGTFAGQFTNILPARSFGRRRAGVLG